MIAPTEGGCFAFEWPEASKNRMAVSGLDHQCCKPTTQSAALSIVAVLVSCTERFKTLASPNSLVDSRTRIAEGSWVGEEALNHVRNSL